MGIQQFQKLAVASTEMQTHKRKKHPSIKIQKQSELSHEVLYVNQRINTISQKYKSNMKIPAAQRKQHPQGGFTNIKRHGRKFNRPAFVHPCIHVNHSLPVSKLLLLEIRPVCTVTVDHVQWLCFRTRC